MCFLTCPLALFGSPTAALKNSQGSTKNALQTSWGKSENTSPPYLAIQRHLHGFTTTFRVTEHEDLPHPIAALLDLTAL